MLYLISLMITFCGFLWHKVEPNQEFHGMVCEGANVLPSKFLEYAFRNSYGRLLTYSAYLLCLKNISIVCHFGMVHGEHSLILNFGVKLCRKNYQYKAFG